MHCLAKNGTVPYLIVANPESSWQGYLAALLGAQFFNKILSLLSYEAQVVQRSNEIFLCLCLREYNIKIIDFFRG
jgi:hypothetical protein